MSEAMCDISCLRSATHAARCLNKVRLLCSSALTGDLGRFSPGSLAALWWLVLLGGLAQTGIYFFYYRNLKTHEVWQVKLALLLMPVLSCFIGVFFLDERLTAGKLLGVAVVLLGAALLLLRGRLHPEG